MIIFLVSILLASCQPRNQQVTGPYSKTQTEGSLEEKEPTPNSKEPQDSNQAFNPESALPNYRKEDLPKGFNRNPQTDPKDPKDEGKKLQMLRVPFYRILWMNLTQKTWGDTVNKWGGKLVGDPLSQVGIGATPRPDFVEPGSIAIFQPMPPLRDEAIETGYRVLGHTVQASLGLPTYPTALFALMPGEKDPLMAEPDDFELLYSEGALGYNELYAKCLSPKNQMKVYVITELQTYCADYLPEIYGNISNTHVSGYQVDPNSGPVRWKNWFDVLTVAIWRPLPREGYGCLGFFATNGEGGKPKSEMVDPEYGPSGAQSEMGQAYCLKEDLLSPGELGEAIGQTRNGKITFHKIRAKNPEEGYDETHFFYAKKTADQDIKDKLWVVKKSILKIHPDESLDE
jgi:hypothetical protein